MRTKLFLIVTFLISTITISQTSRKGYVYYKASSDTKTNKAELVDAIVKDAGDSDKIAARTGRNPQTGKEIKGTSKTNDLHLRKRPGRSQGDPIPGMEITKEQSKVGIQSQGQQNSNKAQDHNTSRSNTTSSKIDTNPNRNNINRNLKRKQSGRTTKATDYNSSRSNRTTNN